MLAPDTLFAPAARVLVIDSDPAAVAELSAGLAACFAVAPRVEVLSGGKAASDLLRRTGFDLVAADLSSLCDVANEPDEAIARLAKLAGAAITIVLAGDSSVSAAVAAMRAGAHDYVAKPIDVHAFARKVAALTLRHGTGFELGPAVRSAAEPREYPPLALATSQNLPAEPAPQASRRPAVLPMWQQEQQIIEHAIASFAGNVALAAAALQLSPSTIYRKRQAWADAESGSKGAA